MMCGRIRWFSYSKRCGSITPDDGSADVFMHSSDLMDERAECLAWNQRVRYRLRSGPKGAVASDVHVLDVR